jgi:hypothetical protein
MYSILYTENDKPVEKKTAKRIKKSMASMNQIRSESHQLYSIKLNKIGLNPDDDKR